MQLSGSQDSGKVETLMARRNSRDSLAVYKMDKSKTFGENYTEALEWLRDNSSKLPESRIEELLASILNMVCLIIEHQATRVEQMNGKNDEE